MEIESGNLVMLALGAACLCGVAVVLMMLLNFVGDFFGAFFSLFGVFFDVLSGGPVSWCGCVVTLALVAGCGWFAWMMIQALSTCGTPQAVNFCSLFGGR